MEKHGREMQRGRVKAGQVLFLGHEEAEERHGLRVRLLGWSVREMVQRQYDEADC